MKTLKLNMDTNQNEKDILLSNKKRNCRWQDIIWLGEKMSDADKL